MNVPDPTRLSTAEEREAEGEEAKKEGHRCAHQAWYCLQFYNLCQFCLMMPLVGLAGCIVIACLFQFGDIQETACKVRNVVPSISAVTGISPGCYLWRVAIAFHLGPRLLIAITYYHFLMSFASVLPWESARKLKSLLNCCFYLQVLEIVGLCLISFIHNREHFPTHRNGFILYTCSSQLSFILNLRMYDVIWPLLNQHQIWSYRKKLASCLVSIASLFIMAYYYYRHFIHCDDYAFSKFATAEYSVAVTNMAFYSTISDDLPSEDVVVLHSKCGCHFRSKNPDGIVNNNPQGGEWQIDGSVANGQGDSLKSKCD